MSAFSIIGHRGYPEIAPENTLISFEKAVAAGADMVECDVALTRDSEVVVIHDDTLKRTTSGRGPVLSRTLAELKSLDAGSWFSGHYQGEKIPTLLEVLDLVKGRCAINVEIKKSAMKKNKILVEHQVVQDIKKMSMEGEVVVSSFEPIAVKRVKQLNPRLECAVLFWAPMRRAPDYYVREYLCDAVHLNVKNIVRMQVERCLMSRVPVRVYTVNQAAEAKRLKEWGVAGIVTDKVAKMVDLFKS